MDENSPRDGFIGTLLVFTVIGSAIYVLAGIGAWTVWHWLTGG